MVETAWLKMSSINWLWDCDKVRTLSLSESTDSGLCCTHAESQFFTEPTARIGRPAGLFNLERVVFISDLISNTMNYLIFFPS